MRILFIYPRMLINVGNGNMLPTAALSLASFMQQEGHVVRVCDRSIDRGSVSQVIDAFQPDVLACTLMFAQQIADMQAVCREVRALRPGLPILCGGLTASLIPETILKEGLADYVGVGEGEYTLLELLEVVSGQREPSTVQSLVYLDRDGQPARTPLRPFADLGDFPETDFSLLPMDKYFAYYPQAPRTMSVYASKGCPGHCTFCLNAAYHRCQYRPRKRETVMRELEALAADYGADGFAFFDELWGMDKQDLRAYCDDIAALSAKLGRPVRWVCETRVGMLDLEDLERMARAGCFLILFGMESGSPEILERMKKGYPLERLETDINNCKLVGISTMPTAILGFPGETPAQIRQTVHLIFRLNPTFYSTSLFSAIPGTAEYNRLVSAGRLTPPTDLAGWAAWESDRTLPANYAAVPDRELKVINCFFQWRMLFQNRGDRKTGRLDYLGMALRRAAGKIGRKGAFAFFLKHLRFAFHVAWHYYAYPGIRRKYDLYPRSFGRRDWDDLSHLQDITHAD